MSVTMKEIAKELNLSIATVSRALAGKEDGVSEGTKKAILEVVRKYGYRKRKVKAKSIAFVIDRDLFSLSSQFYNGVIAGIEEELINQKFYFHFNSVERENFDLERINLNFNDLAGIIMVGVYHDDFVLKLRKTEIPMVLLDYYIPTEDLPAVLIDNVDGILKAAKHLSSLGHKRVAFLAGDQVEMSSQERLYGYRKAQEEFDFDRDKDMVVLDCKSRVDEGFRGMNALLKRSNWPTAVLANNDLIAVGAMDAIKYKGLAIPKDISVVGFDDNSMASEVNPNLTTVSVPNKEMGSTAISLLLHVVRDRIHLPYKILTPTTLVVRDSTGKRSL